MLDDTTKMGRFQAMLRAELNKVNDFACVSWPHWVCKAPLMKWSGQLRTRHGKICG